MRSPDVQQLGMFSYVSVEDRVPRDHPIRKLRILVVASANRLGVSDGATTAHAIPRASQWALHARRPFDDGRLIHHSDRGSQYVSIRYIERLAEAGIDASVGVSATRTTTPWPR